MLENTLLQHTAKWVSGEVVQGKVMLAVGILLLLACVFLWQSASALHRGVAIPLAIVMLVNLGYGGYILKARPALLAETEQVSQEDVTTAIDSEKERAANEIKAYASLKYVWIGLAIVSGLSLFFFTPSFVYGIALGMLILAVSGMTIDSFLMNRISQYAVELNRA